MSLYFTIAGAEAIAEAEAAVSSKPLKQMKMRRDPKKLRMGGGKVWQDPSLDDWIKGRLFVACGFCSVLTFLHAMICTLLMLSNLYHNI